MSERIPINAIHAAAKALYEFEYGAITKTEPGWLGHAEAALRAALPYIDKEADDD